MNTYLFVLEMIGTIAFAIAGALVAIEEKMDMLGVCILGMTTASGGGIIRDIILGVTPPAAFRDPVYVITAIAVSLIIFSPAVRSFLRKEEKIYDWLLIRMDSVGLGIFTAVGVETAMSYTAKPSIFLAVFIGVLTGVGGGVLRDLFAQRKPYIFVKHFYATASIIGAFCAVIFWYSLGRVNAMIICAAVTIVLRLLAARYRWHLPHAVQN